MIRTALTSSLRITIPVNLYLIPVNRIPANCTLLPSIQCIDTFHIIIIQLKIENLGVRLDARWSSTFGQWYKTTGIRLVSAELVHAEKPHQPFLKRPSNQDLCRITFVLVIDPGQNAITLVG